MKDAGLPHTFEEALTRVRASGSDLDGYALLGSFFFFLHCINGSFEKQDSSLFY